MSYEPRLGPRHNSLILNDLQLLDSGQKKTPADGAGENC